MAEDRTEGKQTLCDARRQRADALLRMASAPDKPGELPSDLPYVQATEYLALAEATDRLVVAARALLSASYYSDAWRDAADELARQLRWFA